MAFVLGQPPQGHYPFALSYHYQSQPVAMDGGNGEAGDGGASGGGAGAGGWSEDDLLASLSSFGVEGEDERNLSTIKAMLASGWGGGNAAAGGIGTAFNSQGFHSHNPPPNTPTLSKSMELYSSSLNGSGGNGSRAYFDGNNRGESSRRRDVSLERGPAGRDRSHSRATQEMDASMEEDEEGEEISAEIGQEDHPVHRNGRLNAFGMPVTDDTGGGSGVLQNTQMGWPLNGSNGHGTASYTSSQPQQQQQSPFSNSAFASPVAPNPFQANSIPGSTRSTPPNTRSRTRLQQQQQQQQHR